MISFADRIAALEAEGYANATAMARLAHDVVLKALESCGLRDNITIKGGVVMSSVSGDVRRATMDMDIDFVHYGLSDENIDEWIARLNCIEGVSISRDGDIVELRQQNYRGRRVYLAISDSMGVEISTKLDIGVHMHEDMPQREMPFQISLDDSAASLLANTKEQMFAEKLKSLLRLGSRSNRPKDIFDMYYLIDKMDRDVFRRFVALLVFEDKNMRERDFGDVCKRVSRIFGTATYMRRLSARTTNWLQIDPKQATSAILDFLKSL